MPADMRFLVTGGGVAGRLGSDLFQDADDPYATLVAGTEVGSFVLEQRIGAGGGGVVFAARRAAGFAQRVAIKFSRVEGEPHGFDLERNLLARLEHRGIVRIIDGGTLDGLPWAAMELVDGAPIDRHCAERALSWRRRIELVRQVADALHYAHQRQVIHGDIKVSNILVTAEGEPRVLDFGVAQLASADAVTRACTPACASPEQLRGEALTTASDVFQLGRLLEAVLPPDVPMPRLVRRNLGALVACLLQPAATARPESMAMVRDDLARLLAGHACRAARWTLASRARFLFARHRIAAGIVLAGGIATGVALAATNARLAQEESRASDAAHAARVNAEFMANLFRMAAPNNDRVVTVVDVLDQGARRLVDVAAATPLDRAILAQTIGAAYLDLQRPVQALEIVEKYAPQPDDDSIPPLLQAQLITIRAWGQIRSGRIDAAKAGIRQASRLLADGNRPEVQSVRVNVQRVRASIARSEGAMADAAAALQRGIRENPAAGSLELARAQSELGMVYDLIDRSREGLVAHRRAAALAAGALGQDSPPALELQRELAFALANEGETAEAERLLEHQEAAILASYGKGSLEHSALLSERGVIAFRRGANADAIRYFTEELRMREHNGSADSIAAASTTHNLAAALAESGRVDESIGMFRKALALQRRYLSENEQVVLMHRLDLALALCMARRFDESQREFDAASAQYRVAIGGRDIMNIVVRERIECLADHGRRADALALFDHEFMAEGPALVRTQDWTKLRTVLAPPRR